MDRGIDEVLGAARDGDLVLTLGAGSVSQAGDRILARLKEGR
jgi:UDP-N-acetylmuramate--alanine ligase